MSEDRSSHPQEPQSWLGKVSSAFSSEPKNREELLDQLREAHTNQLLDTEALGIIEGALQVSEMQVREIMIPRSQMICVKADQAPEDFLPHVISSAHSRFPVIGESTDEVKGILLAKDLLPLLLHDSAAFDLKKAVHPAIFVPESKRLNVLLHEFRTNRNHMAMVIDEYGGVAGLVTIEDVLEQIVGDIEDEHDVDEDAFIRKTADNEYIVKALTPIEEFNDEFECGFSDKEFDTIGGLVMQGFGRLPEQDECLSLGDFEFKVLSGDKRRLKILRVKRN